MTKKDRVAVYIDGSNFYKYLKHADLGIKKGVKFDYSGFIDYLTGKRRCVFKGYYVGIARDFDHSRKSKKIVMGQQKFLTALEKEGFTIGRGRLMYDDGDIREKGTDVKIAVDLVVDAADNVYDTAIIVSSDTDLIPAIEYVRSKSKRIEYVGFSHAPSFGMQKNANSSVLLRPQDMGPLVK